ncbi:MAG: ribonuclease [Actinomycetota bacterium]|nr:ribonuclease [Actinomycetota bacterium]
MGLDTEFMRERTYRARLCLVQISTPDGIYVVDPLEVEDLSEIANLIADPGVEVVVHAGRQDLEIFYERYGVVPSRIYDIQLAAAFAGLGASLPYGRLVQEVTGANLKKGESYTDWCHRPLTKEQMTYAADDVRYLLDAAAELKRRLDQQGRDTWVVEELAAFETKEAFETNLDEVYKRVGGRGSLTGKQLGVLREVARWREMEAQRRDTPRGWVVKDPTLIEIARRAPTSIPALAKTRGLNPKESERFGSAILAAIETGLSGEEIKTPKAPPRSAQVRARVLSGPCDAIVRSRCEAANLATELVSTRGELEALLADISAGVEDLSRHRMMRGWRKELAGDHVVAFASGAVSLHATERPPYIEEVGL